MGEKSIPDMIFFFFFVSYHSVTVVVCKIHLWYKMLTVTISQDRVDPKNQHRLSEAHIFRWNNSIYSIFHKCHLPNAFVRHLFVFSPPPILNANHPFFFRIFYGVFLIFFHNFVSLLFFLKFTYLCNSTGSLSLSFTKTK